MERASENLIVDKEWSLSPKNSLDSPGILESPPHPRDGWECPYCGGSFRRKHVREYSDGDGVKHEVYVCKSCGEETDFALSHPNGAI